VKGTDMMEYHYGNDGREGIAHRQTGRDSSEQNRARALGDAPFSADLGRVVNGHNVPIAAAWGYRDRREVAQCLAEALNLAASARQSFEDFSAGHAWDHCRPDDLHASIWSAGYAAGLAAARDAPIEPVADTGLIGTPPTSEGNEAAHPAVRAVLAEIAKGDRSSLILRALGLGKSS
jgi:hypothetical protein